jgi:drug/metabolite transporter (DMT)-like permease
MKTFVSGTTDSWVPQLRSSGAPLLAVAFWSGNFIVTKLSAGTIEPGAIGFYRCAVAVLVMTPFLLPAVWRRRTQVTKKLPQLAILGLFGTALYQGLAYFASPATTATHMGIITALVPFMTMALTSILARQRPKLHVAVGGFIPLVGIFVLVTQGSSQTSTIKGLSYGDGFMFLASLSYSLYCVLLSRWTLPFSLWESLYLQSICAWIQFLPVFLGSPSSKITVHNLPLILYAGIAASVIAPVLWMRGIAKLGANRTSIFMNILPLLTTVFAIIILGEKITFCHVIGGLMAIAGVGITQIETMPKQLSIRERIYVESP